MRSLFAPLIFLAVVNCETRYLRQNRPSLIVWETVMLGAHSNHVALREELEQGGSRISERASELFLKTPLAQAVITVSIVRVTVAELGFPQGTTTAGIFARAKELGLERLPAEIGPVLRLVHANQRRGECIRIGMNPIADSDGYPNIFYIDLGDDGRWLRACNANPARQWSPESVWIFAGSKPH